MVNKKDYDIKNGEIDGSYTLNGTKYWMRNTPFVKNKPSMRIYFSKEENKSSLTFKTLFYLREIKERLGSEFRKTFPRITIHQLAFSDAETILSTLWSQPLNKQTQPKTAKLIKELVKIKNKEDEECAPYLEQIRCVLESDSKAKKKKTPYGNEELNKITDKNTHTAAKQAKEESQKKKQRDKLFDMLLNLNEAVTELITSEKHTLEVVKKVIREEF